MQAQSKEGGLPKETLVASAQMIGMMIAAAAVAAANQKERKPSATKAIAQPISKAG
jgi:hypothetical protein